MRTFSGRSATQTVSPGLAPGAGAARSAPGGGALDHGRAAAASTTRPSIRFTSPMKSATQREFGCS